ncbi:MAG: response regulator, partial [Ktedonobacteraceae bacterium]
PGHGSTFGFTLPLAQVLEPTTFPQETLLGKRILVVDDETETRHLLRSYLQGAGYEVMTAPNATAAFQLARTARPDLITLDMLLPNNAGLPILELLKSDAITANIPVILLTVVNNDGQMSLLGTTDYLNKPIEASDLLQRITTVFANQTHRLILLVTSESESLEPLASALREVGHRVMFVPDGRELLALVKRAHPGLIILDAMVPPMGGLALLQALRANPATRKLPVIMTDIQPGEMSMHWHTLTPIGYVDIWGNPSHVNAIVDVITQRLQTDTGTSVPMIPG